MKSLLKKILPEAWITVIAIHFNKYYRSITTTLLFKDYPSDLIIFFYQEKAKPVDFIPQDELSPPTLPPVIKEAFDSFVAVEQFEFFACVNNCMIEPKYGWPITSNYQLVYDCFPYSRQNIVPVPSVLSLFNNKKKYVEKIISFREIFDFGYWHFFTDILHKAYVLNAHDALDKNVPILVSKNLASQSYFKFFVQNTSLFEGREIIVQDDFLMIAQQVFFIKPMPHRPAYYHQTTQLVKSWKGDLSKKRNIFLNRSSSRGRFISNMDEVIPVLQKLDIELVDADTLTIQDQIKLFSETVLVVGIHGAGLSNIMFRFPASLTLIEIFPWATGRFQIPPHYFLMSRIFKFSYHAILGSHYKDAVAKSFSVDINELELMLRKELHYLNSE